MRICILNEFFYPDATGGTGTVLSELARSLQSSYPHVDIDVVTSRHLYRGADENLPACENWLGIKISRLPTPNPNGKGIAGRLFANFCFSLAAFRHIEARQYDVLLVTTAPPTGPITALLLKNFKQLPYVYTVYDLEPDRAIVMRVTGKGNPVARVLFAVQKLWLANALKIVVLGRCMRDYVSLTYDLPASRIQVIPIGADENTIPVLSRNSSFRQEHGLTGFIALYSGNFGRYHNFDTILDAAKALQAQQAGITFVLVGNGSQRPRILQRIEDERLDNVKVFPFVAQEDYADLLASADVSLVNLEPGMEGICVPSKFYSILSSGRPTIAMLGAASEVARVIEESECGIQIEQGATDQLVQAIKLLHDQPELAERMGQNARQVLVEKYGMAACAHLYYEAFGATFGDGCEARLALRSNTVNVENADGAATSSMF